MVVPYARPSQRHTCIPKHCLSARALSLSLSLSFSFCVCVCVCVFWKQTASDATVGATPTLDSAPEDAFDIEDADEGGDD